MRTTLDEAASKGRAGRVGRRAAVLAASVATFLLLSPLPALAQRGGGGGSHGGGGGGSHGGGGGGSHGGGSYGGGSRGGGSHGGGGARGSAPGARSGGGYSRGSAPGARGYSSGYRGYSGSSRGYRVVAPRSTAYRGTWGHHPGTGNPPGHGYRPGYGRGHYPGWGGYSHYRPAYWGSYGFYPWYVSTWWWWGSPYWGWGWYGWPGAYGYVADGVGVASASRYAAVKTDITPEEAEVWLEGRYIGTADDFDGYPDYLYLAPGKYHMEFQLTGHEPLAIDLDVSRGELTRIDKALVRKPGTSKFLDFQESKGMPLGRVFGAGGKTPSELGLPRVGEKYDVREESGGLPGAGGEADAPRARGPESVDRMPMSEVPPPRAGRARLRFSVTPEDAAIYVDDRYVGAGEELNASPRGLLTDPGKHSVTVVRPGFKTKTVEVEGREGKPVDVVVDLEK